MKHRQHLKLVWSGNLFDKKNYKQSLFDNCLSSLIFIEAGKINKIKFGKLQTAILEEWIKSHEEFTYPKYNDLAELIETTGLTDKQIRVWFTNHRNVSFAV